MISKMPFIALILTTRERFLDLERVFTMMDLGEGRAAGIVDGRSNHYKTRQDRTPKFRSQTNAGMDEVRCSVAIGSSHARSDRGSFGLDMSGVANTEVTGTAVPNPWLLLRCADRCHRSFNS
jgi:hypothetical protein